MLKNIYIYYLKVGKIVTIVLFTLMVGVTIAPFTLMVGVTIVPFTLMAQY